MVVRTILLWLHFTVHIPVTKPMGSVKMEGVLTLLKPGLRIQWRIMSSYLVFCTFPELSASCDSAHEALNEPADFSAQAPY